MSRLTRDGAFIAIDQFEEFIHAAVGRNVTFKRTVDAFVVLIGKPTVCTCHDNGQYIVPDEVCPLHPKTP